MSYLYNVENFTRFSNALRQQGNIHKLYKVL